MPARPALVHSLINVPRLGRHVKRAHDAYLRRRCERYWDDPQSPARRGFAENRPVLNAVQQRLLTDFQARGVAYCHFDELVGEPGLWSELRKTIRDWTDSSGVRERARSYSEGGYRNTTFKEYLIKLYGYDEDRVIPWSSAILRTGVHPRLLDVVNSYMGMHAWLRYVDAWYTVPVSGEISPSGSQCWHRDPEDMRIAKVFLYFSDVTLSTGALEYVPNSRAGERWGDMWPHKVPSGSRAPTEGVAQKIPREEIEACEQPAGTFVLVDTTGLHRGGRAISGPRVFSCWEYVSPAAPFPRSFIPGWPEDGTQLTPAAKAALSSR